MRINLPDRFQELAAIIDLEQKLRTESNALIRVKGVFYVIHVCRNILAGRVEKSDHKGTQSRNYDRYVRMVYAIDELQARCNRFLGKADDRYPITIAIKQAKEALLVSALRGIRKGGAQ